MKVKKKRLYFRGQRIVDALLDEFLRIGIENATEVILSGRSAGALAAILRADYIRSRLPHLTKASFRVLADAGLFLDAPSLNGSQIIRTAFRRMFALHNSSSGLNQACLRAQKPGEDWLCLFPQYSVPFVRSPLFFVNSLYDVWQIAYLYNVPCVLDIKTCNPSELFHIMKFRETMLHAMRLAFGLKSSYWFLDSCLVHTQCVMDNLWTTVQVQNISISQAFASWYNDDE